MLVLSRKKDEVIDIGDNVSIMVIEIDANRVRLGISAPTDVKVNRREITLRIRREEELQQQGAKAS